MLCGIDPSIPGYTGGCIMSLVAPSYSSGYARYAGESIAPNLWQEVQALWVPGLGPTGDTLHDLGRHANHGDLDANAVWDVKRTGWGVDISLDGIAVSPVIDSSTSVFTMFFQGLIKTAANNQYLYDQQTTRMIPIWMNASLTGGTTFVTSFINGSQVNSSNWSTLAAGPITLVAIVTQTPDSRQVWVNSPETGGEMSGPIKRIDSATAFTDWGVKSGAAYIGERYTGNSNKWLGNINILGISFRVWSENEVRQFMADPYAMLRRRPRTYFVPSAPVGGRIMSSLVNAGGLVGSGGIAGRGGGLAG